MKFNIIILLLLAWLNTALHAQVRSFKETSVLADGDVYKLQVDSDGLYNLDFDYLKDTLGINIGSIDPRNIKLYGNGGGVLLEKNNAPRIDDLEELSITIIGERDGSFDQGDKIIFYVEGPDKTKYEDGKYHYLKNPYSNHNYYFLKLDGSTGKRVDEVNTSGGQGFETSHTEVISRHEEDLVNLLGDFGATQGSGQTWYGEEMTNNTTLDLGGNFTFEGIDLSEKVDLEFSFVGRSNKSSEVTLTVGTNNFSKSIRSVRTEDVEAVFARPAYNFETINFSSNQPNIEIKYPSNGTTKSGWLDYLQFIYRKNLIYNDEPLEVFNANTIDKNLASFLIKNVGTNNQIWNISDLHNVKSHEYQLNSNGEAILSFSPNGMLQKFLVFNPGSSFNRPTFIEKIEHQNLHNIDKATLLIVYHKAFEEAAIKLKSHRETHSNLDVKTVEIDKIYNEFSSGKQDPTAIRDFAKMIFDRDNNFKFLVLLGDGSYDYRWINKKFSNQSFVPAYETRESLDPLNAFPTDDYYALLSNGEGGTLRGAIDIAVGRIPAKTAEEANNIVDKIIRYDNSPNTSGDWKNRIAFTADDEDSNIHLNQADKIAREVRDKHPNYNQEKIYFDAFKQVSTPGGARYPDAESKLNNEIFKGMLILNYLGHGGPKGWSQERVLRTPEIRGWENKNKLPLIITATCSFTGFDDPALVTGGEEAILNKNGGAIALFSTVRSVYSSQNFRLTKSVFDTIFSKPDGDYMEIGEILRRAKNSNSADTINVNARKFLLIGDPTLKLSLPSHNIKITEINNQKIDPTRIDTIKALQKVSIKGEVVDISGNIISSYNGTVLPTLFDKQIKLETLANDATSPKKSFEVQRNILYSGTASVTNGSFSFDFVVPKDINYSYGPGKLSFYATNEDRTDAAGYYNELIIGGTDSISTIDNAGPALELYMNDEEFVSGGITNENPELYVKLFDDNGINFSGTSIGHDITAILDDNTQETIILNDFYKSDIDDFRTGSVRFPLKDLEPGLHKLKVKAFDVLNNVGEAELEFYVLGDDELKIDRLLNYPNPFTTSTKFMFEHNLPNTNLSSVINIYTMTGKLVKSIVTDFMSTGFRSNDIIWNGKDDFDNQLGRGIYLYQVQLNAKDLGITINSDFEKLLLLR